ncbi:MAG: 30S ribosomal protein S9 [Candidatus Methylomirabilis sp.]|nr:30S ribosomal protein S9 [Deltaproteobacteria bacterium]
MAQPAIYATGRRKTSVARVYLRPGAGAITVNGRPMEEHFRVDAGRRALVLPLELTNAVGLYDIAVNVRGGGVSGQAGAVRDGISKALIAGNPNVRPTLKRAGLVTRDDRIKERKKYGHKGARKSFQFSKR